MNMTSDSLLGELARDVDKDFARFKRHIGISGSGNSANKFGRSRRDFAMYLISVATHPIGLTASMSPLNCNEEQMLGYIAEAFSLDQQRISQIFKRFRRDANHLGGPVKRHSWRPELRVRISPPKISSNIEGLQMRVYLFKENPTSRAGTDEPKTFKDKSEKNKWVLEHIFRVKAIDSSNMIRPVNELRSLIKFEPVDKLGSNDKFRLVDILGGTKSQTIDENGDLVCSIRRYYCDPKTAHILRFEFWIDHSFQRETLITKYRRIVRGLLIQGIFHKRTKSAYMEERQEFFGYINLKLSQLPAYANKLNCTIKTLDDAPLSSCEIIVEPRNRRLHHDDHEQNDKKKSSRSYLINHMRLYINCTVYQCLDIETTLCTLVDQTQAPPNMTLDNLFYLPAHTLINQHRLQSNLNQSEDLKLRRISLWMILIKLQLLKADSKFVSGTIMVIMSILNTDYLISRGKVDAKTMRESDPFQDGSSLVAEDTIRDLIIQMELQVLHNYSQRILGPKLKEWLLSVQVGMKPDSTERSITLLSLRLFKTAISHIKRCDRSQELLAKASFDETTSLRASIERILCKIIISHIINRIIKLLSYKATQSTGRRGSRILRPVRPQLPRRKTRQDSWPQLVQDLKSIDNDLSLNWSKRGLKGLVTNHREYVKSLGIASVLQDKKFSKIIQLKIDHYIKAS